MLERWYGDTTMIFDKEKLDQWIVGVCVLIYRRRGLMAWPERSYSVEDMIHPNPWEDPQSRSLKGIRTKYQLVV